MSDSSVRISIAGNTALPALQVLRQKGYAVALSYVGDANGTTSSSYTATRDGQLFAATAPEELLGLVAMWEVRGNDWRRLTDSERAWHDALLEAARVYDCDGNEVVDG
ncbi:hypothetical protein ABZS66_55190 [Dactylosporangium sp. NPDC005572]|uniref:hypothetical protein n=1 Tax=Dactylosporangium sp. NPDC005572 TaxID=3156889 RepID=UPI0033ACEFD7